MNNGTGAVVERYEYDAYGRWHVLEPNHADDLDGKPDYGDPYLFTGGRVDILDEGSLKIQYNRNRYYDHYTGRWTTHDPLDYFDGMNFYEYVGSIPTGEHDPFGLWFRWSPWTTLLKETKEVSLAEALLLAGPYSYAVAVKSGRPAGPCAKCCEAPYEWYKVETHKLWADFDVIAIGGVHVKGRYYTNLLGTVWQVLVHAWVDIELPIEKHDEIIAVEGPDCLHPIIAAGYKVHATVIKKIFETDVKVKTKLLKILIKRGFPGFKKEKDKLLKEMKKLGKKIKDKYM
ncbi:MAG: RHS repeat domain-containing protein [Planctomycetota bacterium]|jgi:RHS repeat-associated protein